MTTAAQITSYYTDKSNVHRFSPHCQEWRLNDKLSIWYKCILCII